MGCCSGVVLNILCVFGLCGLLLRIGSGWFVMKCCIGVRLMWLCFMWLGGVLLFLMCFVLLSRYILMFGFMFINWLNNVCMVLGCNLFVFINGVLLVMLVVRLCDSVCMIFFLCMLFVWICSYVDVFEYVSSRIENMSDSCWVSVSFIMCFVDLVW